MKKLYKSKFILKWGATIVFILGIIALSTLTAGSVLAITISILLFFIAGALLTYIGLYHQLEKDIEIK